ncbi:MAG: retropepsin-like aspartic protease [Methylococcaceae bacterium]|nr:retropepsin-like aspartic protease [Methylococcaceae bacterium]MDZ4219080.1 retropepsin-like aspartic protease [Methylobacter sp.]MDP2394676.1 retropepsin-like aspartic protease [Methylococcaceae bacterium]MDP3019163.1 retropepsin-like aspartic protease [Methylococcaceae bacterium]MDP3389655.1 retropepsin-like aspartic protease [Methylococcaceae bacterium]
MGMQDRDYYRERHKVTPQSPGSTARKSRRNNTGVAYLLYPLITLAGLWYGADNILEKINWPGVIPASVPEKKDQSLDLVSGGVALKTDNQGHFRGIALINNVPMPFLIDTGATRTSIPANLAVAANLPFGSAVQSKTAGGQVTDHLTRINSLQIGNAEIRDLDANINQYLDEVLIGMNTLKYFHMAQNGDTLTLVANNYQAGNSMPINTLIPNNPIKKPITMKKTVTCDENKACKTTYSDR